MDKLAAELNELLLRTSKETCDMLSEFGKNLFFPRGILAQSQEAKEKATKYNATIGIAVNHGEPFYLNSIHKSLVNIDPKMIYPYAPASGVLELRKLWKEKQIIENISLKKKYYSLPLVTSGITSGLSTAGDLFVNQDDIIVCPDKFWGNYRLIFSVKLGAKLKTFSTFKNSSFNVDGMRVALEEATAERGKVILILNFPNNPTGYSPSEEEAMEIVTVIKSLAAKNIKVVVICDDAYYGLTYDDSIKESIFSYLADVSKNVLAIRLDGATKEEYVWGFRIGFISFATKVIDENTANTVYSVLEAKAKGSLRAALSNCSHLSQTLLLNALKDDNRLNEKAKLFEILKNRYYKVKEILKNPKYSECFSVYPFNSGYFMCIRLNKVNAEVLRKHMLNKHGVGLISIGDSDIRIAFSSVDIDCLEDLFDLIYSSIKELE